MGEKNNKNVAIGIAWTTHCRWQQPHQGIDHYIAAEMYLRRRHSFFSQIGICFLGRGEKDVTKVIRHDAVDLFWHRSIERS